MTSHSEQLPREQHLADENHCKSERESWDCPNMKSVEGDTSMEYEHYECKLCGRTMKLDYEEMR